MSLWRGAADDRLERPAVLAPLRAVRLPPLRPRLGVGLDVLAGELAQRLDDLLAHARRRLRERLDEVRDRLPDLALARDAGGDQLHAPVGVLDARDDEVRATRCPAPSRGRRAPRLDARVLLLVEGSRRARPCDAASSGATAATRAADGADRPVLVRLRAVAEDLPAALLGRRRRTRDERRGPSPPRPRWLSRTLTSSWRRYISSRSAGSCSDDFLPRSTWSSRQVLRELSPAFEGGRPRAGRRRRSGATPGLAVLEDGFDDLELLLGLARLGEEGAEASARPPATRAARASRRPGATRRASGTASEQRGTDAREGSGTRTARSLPRGPRGPGPPGALASDAAAARDCAAAPRRVALPRRRLAVEADVSRTMRTRPPPSTSPSRPPSRRRPDASVLVREQQRPRPTVPLRVRGLEPARCPARSEGAARGVRPPSTTHVGRHEQADVPAPRAPAHTVRPRREGARRSPSRGLEAAHPAVDRRRGSAPLTTQRRRARCRSPLSSAVTGRRTRSARDGRRRHRDVRVRRPPSSAMTQATIARPRRGARPSEIADHESSDDEEREHLEPPRAGHGRDREQQREHERGDGAAGEGACRAGGAACSWGEGRLGHARAPGFVRGEKDDRTPPDGLRAPPRGGTPVLPCLHGRRQPRPLRARRGAPGAPRPARDAAGRAARRSCSGATASLAGGHAGARPRRRAPLRRRGAPHAARAARRADRRARATRWPRRATCSGRWPSCATTTRT